MVVIADSGSTKCDWRLVDASGHQQPFETMGLNPYFHSSDFIRDQLQLNDALMRIAPEVQAVFFYGAGCSSPKLKRTVEQGLAAVFTNADIHADHDLVAAAFAVYQDEPCISCILGTGSNSCHFDGDIIREEVPALAYILGDEGSGSYYGKRLLADFLYKRLPKVMSDVLSKEYGLTKDVIMDRTYMQPHANVFLASFMPFLTRFKHESYVHNLLREGMRAFMQTHVQCFADYKEVKTHFIGSIARYHEDVLREVAAELNINVGNIVKKPIDGLVDYHIRNYFPKLNLAG